MKKLVTALLLLSLVISIVPGIAGAAAANAAPKLYLDKKELQSAVGSLLVDGTTLVPIRTVTEGLGFDVSWKSPDVTISNGQNLMYLTIGSKTAVVNGREISLAKAAMLTKSTTLVPLRFVGEQFGLDVFWDKSTKSVQLFTNKEPEKSPVELPGGDGSGGSGGADDGQGAGSAGPGGTDEGHGPGNGDPGGMDDGRGPGNGDPGGTDQGNGGGNAGPVGDPEGGSDANSGQASGSDDGGAPQEVKGWLSSIEYNGLGSIYLSYDGEIGDISQQTIDVSNPADTVRQKIAIDLPNTAFADGFRPGFTSGSDGQITIDNMPSLIGIRYAQYKDKPATVRLVLDFTAPTPINVVRDGQTIRIDVLQPSENVPPPVNNDPGVYTVVLDAGHGGKDPGAAAADGRQEKTYNLAITRKVKALLDKEPQIRAYMTRPDDTFWELLQRSDYANDLNADIFISFHANWIGKPSISGTETYYTRSESLELAKTIHKHLVAGTGLPDRGVRKDNLSVTRETKMPAVLLEAGYLSNVYDESVLFDPASQDKIAAEVVAGIKEYFHLT